MLYKCTFPPLRMPSTAMLSAGGGLGPLEPENRPFALSLIFFTAAPVTGVPAVNSNGCM